MKIITTLILLAGLLATAIFAGLGGAAFGADPPVLPKKKTGDFVTADATELRAAQTKAKDATAKEKSALAALRTTEDEVISARQRGIRSSAEEEESRRRAEALAAAKRAMTEATMAHVEARRNLADVQARMPKAADQPQAKQQDQPAPLRRDEAPAEGKTRPAVRNSLSKLTYGRSPTYDWAVRINLATADGRSTAPLPEERWVRPDARTPTAVSDPYDAILGKIQQEHDRGANAVQAGTPIRPGGGEIPAGPVNPALQEAIKRQREKVSKLRVQVEQTDVFPLRGQLERQLQEAERELARLEAQLRSSR